MGYSHYYENFSKLPDEAVDAIKGVFTENAEIVQREYDDPTTPLVTNDTVRFNGVGDDGYETFLLEGSGWNFCKTANKPYDKVVVAVLCICDNYLEDFCWSSDGGFEELKEGISLAKQYIKG